MRRRIGLLVYESISPLVHKSIDLLTHRPIHIFCILCLTVCLIFAPPVNGRSVGTSGSAVLKIGLGAKSTGMGEASVAVADDVSSIYWNPAGLFQIRTSQLSAMHIEWLDDIRYEWVGYAQPLASWATVAADICYAHMGTIPRTVESLTEGYEEDGRFTVADTAGRFAFAGKISNSFLIGASLQVLQSKVGFEDVTKERIGDKKAQSTAIGLGCLYNTPVPNLNVGFCFQNLGRQTQAFVKEKEPMPFAFRLGVAYEVLMARPEPSGEGEETIDLEESTSALVVAMDLDFPADSSFGARMGMEYRFGNGVAIRGGYRTGTGLDFPSGICGGAGYNTSSYQVDYALVPYGDIGNTHRVSFTIRF